LNTQKPADYPPNRTSNFQRTIRPRFNVMQARISLENWPAVTE